MRANHHPQPIRPPGIHEHSSYNSGLTEEIKKEN